MGKKRLLSKKDPKIPERRSARLQKRALSDDSDSDALSKSIEDLSLIYITEPRKVNKRPSTSGNHDGTPCVTNNRMFSDYRGKIPSVPKSGGLSQKVGSTMPHVEHSVEDRSTFMTNPGNMPSTGSDIARVNISTQWNAQEKYTGEANKSAQVVMDGSNNLSVTMSSPSTVQLQQPRHTKNFLMAHRATISSPGRCISVVSESAAFTPTVGSSTPPGEQRSEGRYTYRTNPRNMPSTGRYFPTVNISTQWNAQEKYTGEANKSAQVVMDGSNNLSVSESAAFTPIVASSTPPGEQRSEGIYSSMINPGNMPSTGKDFARVPESGRLNQTVGSTVPPVDQSDEDRRTSLMTPGNMQCSGRDFARVPESGRLNQTVGSTVPPVDQSDEDRRTSLMTPGNMQCSGRDFARVPESGRLNQTVGSTVPPVDQSDEDRRTSLMTPGNMQCSGRDFARDCETVKNVDGQHIANMKNSLEALSSRLPLVPTGSDLYVIMNSTFQIRK